MNEGRNAQLKVRQTQSLSLPSNSAIKLIHITGIQVDSMEGGSERINQTEENQVPLIRGLPDDIALCCLARVPRKYHVLLKCVSRRWRDFVCSEELYEYRKKQNLSETWIYALCRDNYKTWCFVLDPDSSTRRWRCIQGFPDRCSKRIGMGFEALGKNIYVLGGLGGLEAANEAFCYDVSRNTWTKAAPMSTARCYFACHAYDGGIYAIGGLAWTQSDPCSWDIFDTQTKTWKLHSNTYTVSEVEDSIVLDGKIYIRCSARGSTMSSPSCAVIYEPSSGTWQHADADMVLGWQGPAVVVDGTLYVLDQSSGTRLMMWQKDRRDWEAVMRLSTLATKPPCQLAAIGKKIFIIGKGLSTVVFDTSKIGSVDGVMVGSSIPGLLTADHAITCKCLAF